MISGYRRDANDIIAILGCYGAYTSSQLPTFRDNLLVRPSRVSLEDGTHPLRTDITKLIVTFRNVANAPQERYRNG